MRKLFGSACCALVALVGLVAVARVAHPPLVVDLVVYWVVYAVAVEAGTTVLRRRRRAAV